MGCDANSENVTCEFAAISDEGLMERARDGEPAAFAALVKRYQDPLVNFFRRSGAYMDAEDLAQETFIRLFKYRDRYRPTAKLTTFLYTIARHVWLDLLRQQKRRETLHEGVRQEDPGGDDGGMRRALMGMDAREALSRLPEKLSSVVVLSLYQGLRQEEIADVLKVPVGTVKSRMFNAFTQLKEMFSRDHA